MCVQPPPFGGRDFLGKSQLLWASVLANTKWVKWLSRLVRRDVKGIHQMWGTLGLWRIVVGTDFVIISFRRSHGGGEIAEQEDDEVLGQLCSDWVSKPLGLPATGCLKMKSSPPFLLSLLGILMGKACLCGWSTVKRSSICSWTWTWVWDRDWKSRRWSFGRRPSPW